MYELNHASTLPLRPNDVWWSLLNVKYVFNFWVMLVWLYVCIMFDSVQDVLLVLGACLAIVVAIYVIFYVSLLPSSTSDWSLAIIVPQIYFGVYIAIDGHSWAKMTWVGGVMYCGQIRFYFVFLLSFVRPTQEVLSCPGTVRPLEWLLIAQ